MSKTKVLLSSGGMDSFLLAHEVALAGAVHIFVDVGQKYAAKEQRAAEYVAETVGATLHCVTAYAQAAHEHKETGIVPFRNAELILCAAQYGEQIYLGIIADEVNSDKSPEFLDAMVQVLNISHRNQYWTDGRDFMLCAPFRGFTKTDLVRRYLERGGGLPHLYKSVSCYSGSSFHCGKCSSCFKRWVALTVATGKDHGPQFMAHPAMEHPRHYWTGKAFQNRWSTRRIADILEAYDIVGV